MKIILYSTLLFCLFTGPLYSQNPSFLCGNEIFQDIVRRNYPQLDSSFRSTFDACKSVTSNRSGDLVVNVVVHIVWKDASENLDESIILDQLRILNEDFNQLNADQVNLRSQFQAEAGSAAINFHLAEIIRVQTEAEFAVDLFGSNLLPEVKSDLLGGSTAWDPEQFLNIWVCKIQPITIFGLEIGQILGFAFPPNNLANWPANSGAPDQFEDGVVIDYRVFGSNNPNTIDIPGGGGQLPVKGRTPVHEVGHYFGLRHIWGDGGVLGPNDCAQSDGIDDTPFANTQSAFDCDTTKNTCALVEPHYNDDTPDLVENFMDYSSEECMNMFTHGQVTLMRNVLNGPRSGLLMPFSGINDTEQAFSMSILPNPTEGRFEVQFEIPQQTSCIIRIRNASGQVLESISPQKYLPGRHSIQFEGNGMAPGMYFVEIQAENGISSGKIIRF